MNIIGFKVGDRVRDDVRGYGEGVVDAVYKGGSHGVYVEFEGGRVAYTFDSRFQDTSTCPITLFKIAKEEPTNAVLTEWQRKQMKIHGYEPDEIDLLDEILSEPEPTKWMPKEGEVCLFRDSDHLSWVAMRFKGMDGGRFIAQGRKWNQCRPFDLSLIGTTDNP